MAFSSTIERTSLMNYLRALSGARVEVQPRRRGGQAMRRKIAQEMEALESRMLLSTTATFVPGYAFTGGAEGHSPNAVVVDSAGNIYGSTFVGGANGRGTIFEIQQGTTTPIVLDTFSGTDGVGALPSLVVNGQGDLFFTTPVGGTDSNGSIVEIPATGTRTPDVLYSFPIGLGFNTDPSPTLTIDSQGNLYGTTTSGGTNTDGEIFEITASAIASGNAITPTVLYNFASADGTPGSVIVDSTGNVFGVTTTEGSNGTGQLFELGLGQGAITPLDPLPAGVGSPSITLDGNGNIFGTTLTGGTGSSGTIFEYNGTSHALTTVYAFTGGADGLSPNGHIVVDSSDNVFGSTVGPSGLGVVFELPAGQAAPTIIHTFAGTDGSAPTYGLVAGPTGTLYGVTSNGGANSDGTLFSVTLSSGTPSTPTQLAFTAQPASGAAGSLGTVTVEIRDANGDLVTTADSRVTLKLASGPSGAKLTGTLNATAVNGVATFSNVSISAAGTYTLQATDGALTAATTSPFTLTVTATAATHLVFVQQPTTTGAGAAVGPAITVYVEDKKNHLVTSDNSIVNIALTGKPPAGGGISGGTLSVQANGGIATFSDLSFDIAGKYTLLATDGVLKSGKSKAFTVTPDLNSAHLLLTPPSATAVVGGKLSSFSVMLKDQFGNLIKSKSNVVVSVAAGPAGALLGKSTSASISSGTAKFSNVTVLTAGSYTLEVSDASLADAANFPVGFPETVSPGVTTAPVLKPAKSYAVGKVITLNANLKSTAPSTVPYTGSAIITDSNDNVLGTVTVSSKGALKATISNLAAGTYQCTLSYTGDASHTDVLSNTFTLTVA